MNQTLRNFYEILDYAYDHYYDHGLMDESVAEIITSAADPFVVIKNLYESYNSLLEAAPKVGEPKKVKEGKGYGVSITIGGKEYRYVSPDVDTDKLFKSVHGMWTHHAGMRIVHYLRKNALCYYGAKTPSQEGKDLVGYKENIMRDRIIINGVLYESVKPLNESSNELHDRITNYTVEEDDGEYYVAVDYNDKFYRFLNGPRGSSAIASEPFSNERDAIKEMNRVYKAQQELMDEFDFNDEDETSLRDIANAINDYDSDYNTALYDSGIFDEYESA